MNEVKKTFRYMDVMYSMTPKEIEAAYRYQERQYRLQDAALQVERFVYGVDRSELNPEEIEAAEKNFIKNYHRSPVFDAQELADLVDEFEECADCNIPENDMWQAIIERYCPIQKWRCQND